MVFLDVRKLINLWMSENACPTNCPQMKNTNKLADDFSERSGEDDRLVDLFGKSSCGRPYIHAPVKEDNQNQCTWYDLFNTYQLHDQQTYVFLAQAPLQLAFLAKLNRNCADDWCILKKHSRQTSQKGPTVIWVQRVTNATNNWNPNSNRLNWVKTFLGTRSGNSL